MKQKDGNGPEAPSVDSDRRQLLGAAGAGMLSATFGGVLAAASSEVGAQSARALRWGVVGTGGIANSMVPRIQQADHAEPAAVSSRKMEKAQAFADKHGVAQAFDSWADMIAWDVVDAIYVATPTSVREAAARLRAEIPRSAARSRSSAICNSGLPPS